MAQVAQDFETYPVCGSTNVGIRSFDDEGRQFDSKGNLRDWWTPADAGRYVRESDKLVAQFRGLKDARFAVTGEGTAADALRDWQAYLGPWTTWNHVRTVAPLAGSVLMLIGLHRS